MNKNYSTPFSTPHSDPTTPSLSQIAETKPPERPLFALPEPELSIQVETDHPHTQQIVMPPKVPNLPAPEPPEPPLPAAGLPLLDSIAHTKISMCKHVPKTCRSLWGRALSSAISNVLYHNDLLHWTLLFMLPKAVLRKTTRGGNHRKNRKQNADTVFRNLRRWNAGEHVELWREVESAAQSSRRGPRDSHAECLAQAAEGNVAAAAKALEQASPPATTPEAIAKLRTKHPYRPPPPAPPNDLPPPVTAELETVAKALRSFPKGTSGGPSGLTPQLLKEAKEGHDHNSTIKCLTNLVNFMLQGKVCQDVVSFICGARLIALLKPNKDVRPIAVGETFRRLTAKVAVNLHYHDLADHFLPLQVGVAVKGGAESIIHGVRATHARPPQGDVALMKIDFANAFNMLERSAFLDLVVKHFPGMARFAYLCYGNPSRLFIGNTVILSAMGVQQGGPEGPALFCVGLQQLVQKIEKECKLHSHRWYMDDGALIGTPTELSKAWNILATEGPTLGLYLNPSKCEWIGLNGNPPCPIPGVTPNMSGNFEILGAPIGDPNFTNKAVDSILSEYGNILNLLPDLHHSQTATLLLRYCFSYCRAVYVMRTVPSSLYLEAAERFDSRIRTCFESILGTSLNPNPWLQAQLSLSLGGFGLRSVKAHAPGAFLASVNTNSHISDTTISALKPYVDEATEALQRTTGALPSADKTQNEHSVTIDQKLHKDLTSKSSPTDCKRLSSVVRPHANSWIQAPPSQGLGLYFTDAEFRTACLRWLGEDITLSATTCLACNSTTSPKASHTLRCRSNGDMIARHNGLRDLIHSFASSACLGPIKEKAGLLGDVPGQRPADIFIPRLFNGLPTAIDVAVTCPLQERFKNEANPAEKYAEETKHNKYDNGFNGTQIEFVAAVVETFGGWSEEGERTITEIIRRASKRLITCPAPYINTCWQQLSCSLQIMNSRATLSRIPPPPEFQC